ncbi:methyltransferase cognate corrinoid protein [uncultured Anaeromusa sp.]|uniref:methyltransferase cognate corrinoid protein n=1 Tax=uncultured Anaeromusa sp. TaxID=673273 RepID=UPI0029C92724|nr:methyltransferase cognate corrinoid protein [uncultured Anaeromusa sp.]
MRPDQILRNLQRSVEEMEVALAEAAAQEAIAAGTDPVLAINDGLALGMKTVSDLFDEGEAFVPHLLVAAEAFETGASILAGSMEKGAAELHARGKVLIFTVKGDIHDIGKNIVKTMLQANGFQVVDLGRDVSAKEAVTQAMAQNVDIIVAAALMRTTMPEQRELVLELQESGVRERFQCLFGGAPVSKEWVVEIGGDAYASSASEAVEIAKELMAEKRAKYLKELMQS